MELTSLLIIGGVAVLVLIMTMITFATRYKRCPPNQILYKYGKTGRGSAKIIHGGGTFIWPVIQSYGMMSTESYQLDCNLEGARAAKMILVDVKTKVTFALHHLPEVQMNAIEKLSSLDIKDRNQMIQEIVFGQLREIIASMEVEHINSNLTTFREKARTAIEQDMNKLGLTLINITITEVKDRNKLLDNQARQETQKAQAEADIKVAEQEKIGAEGTARYEKEQVIEVAQHERDRERQIRRKKR